VLCGFEAMVFYRPEVELQRVRAVYSSMSGQYIDLVGDGSQEHEADLDLVRRHLTGLAGSVDLGCGPGQWTSYLHSLGADVIGVDMVPEFVDHARATRPGLDIRQGLITELDLPDQFAAGILSWYSTIHLTPLALDGALTEFRRLVAPSGVLVVGFFDSDDTVAEFDHKVVAAYRWPADVFSARLASAGFEEVERLRRQVPERPDRRYAAVAARATRPVPSGTASPGRSGRSGSEGNTPRACTGAG
jgi:SAM-dependent methyltransferase